MSDPFDMEGPIVLAPKGEGTEEGSYDPFDMEGPIEAVSEPYDPFDMEGPIGAPTPEPMWTYPAGIAYKVQQSIPTTEETAAQLPTIEELTAQRSSQLQPLVPIPGMDMATVEAAQQKRVDDEAVAELKANLEFAQAMQWRALSGGKGQRPLTPLEIERQDAESAARGLEPTEITERCRGRGYQKPPGMRHLLVLAEEPRSLVK